MSKTELNNWKLIEIANQVEVVSYDSDDYFNYIVKKLSIPLTHHNTINRTNTYIDWSEMSQYYKFYFDGEGEEKENELALKKSALNEKEKVIINYGFNEPAVLIPTNIFIEEWEDFLASVQYETIMFSEDFELIMEVSRDYYLHSNFKIK